MPSEDDHRDTTRAAALTLLPLALLLALIAWALPPGTRSHRQPPAAATTSTTTPTPPPTPSR
ncbi:hypothetical protein [Kitasatospora sp. NPDC090091]|uniref:hypothetical protein n=1 Tax=Kitasatospora sp. NPDC090091 TaxID=3364081 RepID=UPI0037FF62DE